MASGVRSHCRFRNTGTEYVSESGVRRMSGSTKRQCNRALAPPARAAASSAGRRARLPGPDTVSMVERGLVTFRRSK
jgi:hypothetical protein